MNNQEAFNKAIFGVVGQGCKSLGHDSCQYRGPNETACAVGWLIDERLAQEADFGVQGIQSSVFNDAFDTGILKNVNRDILTDLQSAHDNFCDLGHFLLCCEQIAIQYKLEMPDLSSPPD